MLIDTNIYNQSPPKYKNELTCWLTYQGEEGSKAVQGKYLCNVGFDRWFWIHGRQDKGRKNQKYKEIYGRVCILCGKEEQVLN